MFGPFASFKNNGARFTISITRRICAAECVVVYLALGQPTCSTRVVMRYMVVVVERGWSSAIIAVPQNARLIEHIVVVGGGGGG